MHKSEIYMCPTGMETMRNGYESIQGNRDGGNTNAFSVRIRLCRDKGSPNIHENGHCVLCYIIHGIPF